MATIPINDTAPRVAYTATSGQIVFPYPFWISAEEDIVVYQNGTVLTLTTDYTVSDVLEPTGGDITFVTGATLNDEIVVVRDIPVKRISEFQTGGSFQASVLNSSLSKHVAMIQQVETNQSRSLQLSGADTFSGDMNLPTVTSGKYLKVKDDASGWEMGDAPVVTNSSLSIDTADAHKIVAVNSAGDDFDILTSLGTSGQILTSNGASSDPSWQTPVIPVATNGAFHAYMSSNQTISNNTYTKLQFNAELYDTDGDFDSTTNYRFQPSTAGKYLVFFQISLDDLYDEKVLQAWIYKNGSLSAVGGTVGADPSLSFQTAQCCTTIDFNGTTDYIEAFVYHTSGVSRTARGKVSTIEYTCFNAIKVA
jgi:hypothetical protein